MGQSLPYQLLVLESTFFPLRRASAHRNRHGEERKGEAAAQLRAFL